MIGRKNTENPARKELVLSYRDGYRTDLHDKGVCEKRAKIMKEGKVKDLIQHLSTRIADAEGITCLVLMMDWGRHPVPMEKLGSGQRVWVTGSQASRQRRRGQPTGMEQNGPLGAERADRTGEVRG
jgi:hypothetical protein